uniref:Uncharacterized protein n=1 Tax=Arundo donax TaxID=35708 RepID=A0A0A8Z2W6_ARUDO
MPIYQNLPPMYIAMQIIGTKTPSQHPIDRFHLSIGPIKRPKAIIKLLMSQSMRRELGRLTSPWRELGRLTSP